DGRVEPAGDDDRVVALPAAVAVAHRARAGHDVEAPHREMDRRRLADPAAGPGDERDRTVSRHRDLPLSQWWKPETCVSGGSGPGSFDRNSTVRPRSSRNSDARSWSRPLRTTTRSADRSWRFSGNVYAGTSHPCSRRTRETSNTV